MPEIPVGPRLPHSSFEQQNWGQPGSGGIPLRIEVLGVERFGGCYIFFLSPWAQFGSLISDGITGWEKVIAIRNLRTTMDKSWQSDRFTTDTYLEYRRRSR